MEQLLQALRLVEVIDAKYSETILKGEWTVLKRLSEARHEMIDKIRILYAVPGVVRYLDAGNVKKVRELLGLEKQLP